MTAKFEDLLSSNLARALRELGFRELTSIQEQSLPALLNGEDLIAQSKTGSGKTVAFALAVLEKIQIEAGGPQALVLCPTRELASQVAREIRNLGRFHPNLHVLVVSGGQAVARQVDAFQRRVHIAVATPGRLVDLLRRRSVDLRKVHTLVLDEADRMLEMGFEEDMRQILGALPEKRQTLLFSATFPPEIEKLSKDYQKEPVRVRVAEDSAEPSLIEQNYYEVEEEQKTQLLLNLLCHYQPERALVFCALKRVTAELASSLEKWGVSADALHGDLDQIARDRVMARFRNGSLRVLVATDVAARGLDVKGLDLVVNHDLSFSLEDHTHRIGRTGRAGAKGLALSFVKPDEESKFKKLMSDSSRFQVEKKETGLFKELQPDPALVAEKLSSRWESLFIGAGRKNKLRAGDILGALTGEGAGLPATDVGKIEIHDHFSFVAVNKKVLESALEGLSQGRIKGRRLRVEKLKNR